MSLCGDLENERLIYEPDGRGWELERAQARVYRRSVTSAYWAHENKTELTRKQCQRNLKRLERVAGRPCPEACELCGGVSDRRLHFDHDHACCEKGCARCFRGWICGSCNRALGLFHDNPQLLAAAIRYLEEAACA